VALSKDDWINIKSRLNKGEKAIDLAKEFGVTRGAISKRFSQQQKTVKFIAKQIVETERSIQAQPIGIQIEAITMANELMAISAHMASGAKYHAMNFSRLAGVAHQKVTALDELHLDVDALGEIRTLTIMSNESAKIPIELIKANKDAQKTDDNVIDSFAAWRKDNQRVIGVIDDN